MLVFWGVYLHILHVHQRSKIPLQIFVKKVGMLVTPSDAKLKKVKLGDLGIWHPLRGNAHLKLFEYTFP